MGSRTCTQCCAEFSPSSRHAKCPTCRSKNSARFGACRCGARKRVESALCNTCARSGARNGNWKGGRVLHQKGYVYIRAPEHPRGKPRGYVFEHVLVMEAMLGRYLLPNETVHHKNGRRGDNRPSNLELWVASPRHGIRAEDALVWAREILATYGGSNTPPRHV